MRNALRIVPAVDRRSSHRPCEQADEHRGAYRDTHVTMIGRRAALVNFRELEAEKP